MQLGREGSADRAGPWARGTLILALGTLLWLVRMSLPRESATLELDMTYRQALGVALVEGLRFGHDIVFTSGPLAHFRQTPFLPELYAAKLWLWEVALGWAVALLLCARLVRRGSWLDLLVGSLILIGLPSGLDEWLFLAGLLAADLGLEAIEAASRGEQRRARLGKAAAALFLLSLLALIKVTSLSLALALLAILLLRAASLGGPRSALRWLAGWVGVQLATWMALGQRPDDLLRYMASSLQLASGFDAAMSEPADAPTTAAGIACLAAVLIGCALHLRGGEAGRPDSAAGAARAQVACAVLALLLAFKAGFTRGDHAPTLFGAAAFAPMFLIPLARPLRVTRAPPLAWLRCGLALACAICALNFRPVGANSAATIVRNRISHARASLAWIGNAERVRGLLETQRARLRDEFALPRIRGIVGERGIEAFTVGHAVLFLNDLRWQPRPVFQSFSVFTPRSALANAEFLGGESAPDFVLLSAGTIDRRLPSSEDPLTFQMLLRDFRLREHENRLLLLERSGRSGVPQRASRPLAELGWNERLELPPGDEPLVLQAEIRTSLLGRLRSLVLRTPEVLAEVEFADGTLVTHRALPFALQLGVVLRPWLPTNEAWIDHASGRALDRVVALRFTTEVESAFAPRIVCHVQSAPDLQREILDAPSALRLLLGAAGEIPLRYESPLEPELVGRPVGPTMLLVRAPASLVFAAGPGEVRISARMVVPPWIAASEGFPGLEVVVQALEAGVSRECSRFELGGAGSGSSTTAMALDVPASFQVAGELRLVIRPLPGGDQSLAGLGLRELRVSR